MLTETPFRPREKLLEKQRLFQSIQRHTYLKGPMDKILGNCHQRPNQQKLMQQESRELLEKSQNGQHKNTEEQFYEEYSEHDIVDSYKDDDEEEEYNLETEEQPNAVKDATRGTNRLVQSGYY
ncbi:hypothetical protein Bca52824_006868 [Brassica carinata]|uniref:Uncharacterized protein n=1 Tax=Brassica carinata TaxID=52824 RepID=A0A8X7W822_BRACI|nr:hypothetical protein Bca52824_006868 [Brassica carinata]